MILRQNHEYVDNKLDFKLKSSLSTIHSKKPVLDSSICEDTGEIPPKNPEDPSLKFRTKYALNKKNQTFSPLAMAYTPADSDHPKSSLKRKFKIS